MDSACLVPPFVSMKRFLVPPGCLLSEAGAQEQKHHARVERAAAIGVPWPAAALERRRGQPSLDSRWIAELQRRISNDLDIPAGTTGVRPRWWRPGMELTRPVTVQALEHAAAVGESEDPQEPPVPGAKRQKIHIPVPLSDWFLEVHSAASGALGSRVKQTSLERCLALSLVYGKGPA